MGKWATFVTMQSEIYYQSFQSFYPSELFTLHNITMRHPVVVLVFDYQNFVNKGEENLFAKKSTCKLGFIVPPGLSLLEKS